MQLPEWATKRIGPLPVWGWALAAGGTFGAVWYLHRRQAGGAVSGGAATAVPVGAGGGGGDSGGGGSTFDPTSLLATITQQQQQAQQAQQAQEAALQQSFGQQLSDLAGGVAQQEQAMQAALAQSQTAQQNSLAGGLAAQQQAFAAQLAALQAQFQGGLSGLQQQIVSVPYAGGGTAQVPAKVAQSGSQTPLGQQTPGPAYVAGTQPATPSHPAGGGTWQGLNDQQTQSLFQKTYGSNWQAVWQQQHNAQVAANGG